MKKKYLKPQIMFEDFTISTSVASCSTSSKVKVSTDKDCGFYDEYLKVVVISDNTGGCAKVSQDAPAGYRVALVPGKNDGVCYHVPVESHNTWNS